MPEPRTSGVIMTAAVVSASSGGTGASARRSPRARWATPTRHPSTMNAVTPDRDGAPRSAWTTPAAPQSPHAASTASDTASG